MCSKLRILNALYLDKHSYLVIRIEYDYNVNKLKTSTLNVTLHYQNQIKMNLLLMIYQFLCVQQDAISATH